MLPDHTTLTDLFNIGNHPDRIPWQPFRPGVEIHPLCQGKDTPAQLALLRYQPGASVPRHHHPGFEHILVLWGAQEDDRGRYSAGTLTINPPGSSHRVASPEGCIVLIGWEKPVEIISKG
ncbi:MAG: cupin domain-containing protein [Spirulina sp.]